MPSPQRKVSNQQAIRINCFSEFSLIFQKYTMSQRLELLQQMLASTPGDPFTLFALAKEHEKTGDQEQALGYYLRLYAETPDYVGLYYHLGKLYEQLERLDEAVAVYKQGRLVAKKAGDQHSYNELSGALIQISDETDD